MFGKVFETMYDGTLRECWQAIVIFPHLIVIADQDGVVDLTALALHTRTGIPQDIIEAGLAFLEKEDPQSRSTEQSGRRIERLDAHRDWGWRIVNYKKYRDLSSLEEKRKRDRDRMAAKRKATSRKESPIVAGSRGESQKVAEVAHTNTDTDNSQSPPTEAPKRQKCPVTKIIALYHKHLPNNPEMVVFTNKRLAQIKARWHQDKKYQSLDWWKDFFVWISESCPFLVGKVPPTGDRKQFIANLEWITNPNNFAKIIEGNYAEE